MIVVRLIGLAIAALVGLIAVMSAGDIRRYIRMRQM